MLIVRVIVLVRVTVTMMTVTMLMAGVMTSGLLKLGQFPMQGLVDLLKGHLVEQRERAYGHANACACLLDESCWHTFADERHRFGHVGTGYSIF